jgi:hypothetical protein
MLMIHVINPAARHVIQIRLLLTTVGCHGRCYRRLPATVRRANYRNLEFPQSVAYILFHKQK